MTHKPYGFELAIARIVTAIRRDATARMRAMPPEMYGPELPPEVQQARDRLLREEWAWRLRNVPPTEGERSRVEREELRRGQA